MTTQQLLIPRWRVLGDWPGRELNKYNIDDIITEAANPKELPTDQNSNPRFPIDWAKYPKLFRSIPWWEDRTPEDLEWVKYVKDIFDRKIYPVGEFKTIVVIHGFVLANRKLDWDTFIELKSFHIPITQEEYDQITNKEAG